MLARVRSATVLGVEAQPIEIEVDMAASGLPCFHMVGLPDAGIKEGRTRIRAALENSGIKLPPRKITVNLAPADQRKDGAAYDVPIAIGLLTAAGILPSEAANDALLVGELALDGSVRPVRGVLPIAAWARERGLRRLYVPRANANEAAVVTGGAEVLPFDRLGELVEHLLQGVALPPPPPLGDSPPALGAPDLSELRGQEVARRALEIAAAGGHNLLLVGPPGSGKTMLARRLPGILPGLSFPESLETTMIYSVAGLLDGRALLRDRPFRAPHHTVSVAGLAGGGPMSRPGEISLAHNGVLFLDELLEFPRTALETLRQPLEERSIAIVRVRRTVTYPADFMLCAATNPCPCGHFGNRLKTCTCSLLRLEAYRAKLSGPLLDRIDLHIEVPALSYKELSGHAAGEPSATVRARVEAARTRQLARAPRVNARLPASTLAQVVELDNEAHRLLERAVEKTGLSARAIDRVRRVARTIADLEGREKIRAGDIGEALQYRLLDRVK
jgi:magnesium chelatase family protein